VIPRSFRFEHPKTERYITIRGTSYLWAGLFGAGYVWWIGYGSLWRAVAVNIGFAIGVVAMAGITTYGPAFQQFMVLTIGLPLVVYIQGIVIVSIIRTGFRRRGWMTRIAD
jgi:hypothetical protein